MGGAVADGIERVGVLGAVFSREAVRLLCAGGAYVMRCACAEGEECVKKPGRLQTNSTEFFFFYFLENTLRRADKLPAAGSPAQRVRREQGATVSGRDVGEALAGLEGRSQWRQRVRGLGDGGEAGRGICILLPGSLVCGGARRRGRRGGR